MSWDHRAGQPGNNNNYNNNNNNNNSLFSKSQKTKHIQNIKDFKKKTTTENERSSQAGHSDLIWFEVFISNM